MESLSKHHSMWKMWYKQQDNILDSNNIIFDAQKKDKTKLPGALHPWTRNVERLLLFLFF